MSATPRTNPYHPTRPASHEIFVGREDDCRSLLAALRSQGHAASIAGPAGIGKTSLLNAVQRMLLANPDLPALVAYLDLQKGHASLDLLLRHLADALMAALQSQHGLRCPDACIAQTHALATQRAQIGEILAPILEYAFAHTQVAYIPVLLLDNVHRLGVAATEDLASVLQTAVNQHQITCALAGRDELVAGSYSETSPFRMLISYNLNLTPLSAAQTRELVAKANTCGWEVEEGCDTLAYQLTGGHPYKLHYYLANVLTTSERLSCEGLRRRQPEIEPYLAALFRAEPTIALGSSGYAELSELIRQLIRENRLEDALEHLRAEARWRDHATLLILRLRRCLSDMNTGLVRRDEASAEQTAIAAAILHLLHG